MARTTDAFGDATILGAYLRKDTANNSGSEALSRTDHVLITPIVVAQAIYYDLIKCGITSETKTVNQAGCGGM